MREEKRLSRRRIILAVANFKFTGILRFVARRMRQMNALSNQAMDAIRSQFFSEYSYRIGKISSNGRWKKV